MNNIAWFKELKKEDVAIAGGKGASLAEMYNIPLPVPPGFIVTAQAFKKLLDTGIGEKIFPLLKDLKAEETEKIHQVSDKIHEIILKADMPEDIKNDIVEAYENLNVNQEVVKSMGALDIIKPGKSLSMVAVRSSATAEDMPEFSFAGQMSTYLNIKGKEKLIESVKKCWASLYTPRGIYYRIKNKFVHENVLIAVVVQRMVASDVAGVAFSINPSTNNENEVVIEAAYGLGDAVVGGEVSPDTYVIDKGKLEIKNKKISKQTWYYTKEGLEGNVKKELSEEKGSRQKLSDEGIVRLSEFVKRIEDHYKLPMDIEWAVEANKLYIVQARPVTTMKKVAAVEKVEAAGEIILEGLGASPGVSSGTVKVLAGVQDLGKIQKGDVLVAVMTAPSYVPSMEKSTAIVTDEGGMTCFGENTKVLTNYGFMSIEDAYYGIKCNEELFIFSYDSKSQKPVWKRVINAGRRKRQGIKVSVSQKGVLDHNTINITPDHKMFTFKNRKLIKKEIKNVLADQEYLCLLEKLPTLIVSKIKDKEAYLIGALLSDGCIRVINHKTGNPRRGYVVFTQKETESKLNFIETVKTNLNEVFNQNFNTIRVKHTASFLRGREIFGSATDHICNNLNLALQLTNTIQNLSMWSLSLNETASLNLLAGLIDGDGCFCKNRLHIYIKKENVLQTTILACLRLGIIPQITKNRTIHHVQIVEKMDKILKYTQRVKGYVSKKTMGTKFLPAKQILGDIIKEVNWKGKIKHYVENNLIIDSLKIKERILPMLDGNDTLRKEILDVLNSNLRMQRVKQTEELGEIMVYNLEVEADDELDHNYVVFTEKYTPLLVSNSHASIVSRELGIPCVVGTGKATKELKDNQVVTVDGANGKVYSGEMKVKEEKKEVVPEVLEAAEGVVTGTKIYMNLGEPEKIDEYKNLPFDGIGLMRIEFIITSYVKAHPLYLIKIGKEQKYIDKLSEGISKVASSISGKLMIVRFSDFKTNEYKNLEGGEEYEPHEENPLIGWRGISRYVSDEFREAFKLECKAIKKVRDSFKNVHVMLPFVRNIDEVRKCLDIMKVEGLEMSDDFGVYLMAEVPSMAILAEEFADLPIAGCSIGSNDLTMLVLGVDRDSAKLGRMGYFDERNNAVKKAIKMLIDGFHKHGKTVSICGQSPSVYPEIVEFLVKAGIDSISINPDAVVSVRKHVASIERKILLGKLRAS